MNSLTIHPKYLRLRFCPVTPVGDQPLFLMTANTELGWGAGWSAGKTTGLLMAASQWLDVPGYHALIVRRRLTDLRLPNGLIERAREWFTPWGEESDPSAPFVQWTFPRGGKLTIARVGNDTAAEHAGIAYQFIGIDAADEFEDAQVIDYLSSLLRHPVEDEAVRPRRRMAADGTILTDVPLRLRAAFSDRLDGPGAEWVFSRYLDPETRVATALMSSGSGNPAIR